MFRTHPKTSLLFLVLGCVAVLAATSPILAKSDSRATTNGTTYSVSGHLTDQDGLAINDSNPHVCLHYSDSSFAGHCANSFDANGAYTISGVPAGDDYRAIARSDTHGPQLYDSIVFPTTWASGHAISVGPSNATDIDFQLQPGFTISGTVLDANTGNPVEGIGICVHERSSGYYAGACGSTDVNGTYTTQALNPNSDYTAVVWGNDHSKPYADQLYGGTETVLFLGDWSAGASIDLSGGDVSGIDFELHTEPSLSGRVLEEGSNNAITNAQVCVRPTSLSFQQCVDTDINGDYLFPNLPADDYWAAVKSPTHAAELYDNIEWPAGWHMGDQIAIRTDDVNGIDFGLVAGNTISGQVTDAVSGEPIAGVHLAIHDRATGNDIGVGTKTDADGNYTLPAISPSTDNVVYAGLHFDDPNLIDQYHPEMWDNQPLIIDQWGGGNWSDGDPIDVSSGDITGIDIALGPWPESATVSGTITEEGTGTAIEGATVAIGDWSDGNIIARTTTNASGQYSVQIEMEANRGVLPATRTIVVEAAGTNHAPDRFNASEPVIYFFNRDREAGNGEFAIQPGEQVAASFALSPGSRVEGQITAESSGNGLENGLINIVRVIGHNEGQYLTGDFFPTSDATGFYTSPLALPPGEYALLAEPDFSQRQEYVMEAWNDRACQWRSCPILSTDLVTLAAGENATGIDFDLADAASISGTVSPDGYVLVFDGAGRFLNHGYNPSGPWQLGGLSGGSYYIELRAGFGNDLLFPRILHNGEPCPWRHCERRSGEPLTLPAGSHLTDLDYSVPLGGHITGTIVDAATGETPDFQTNGSSSSVASVDILSESGQVVAGAEIIAGSGGTLEISPRFGIPPGNYYIRTYDPFQTAGVGYAATPDGINSGNITNYKDTVFGGASCAGMDCDLSGATPVTVQAGEINEITIEIETGSSLSGTVVDDSNGEPVPAAVFLLDSANELLASTVTDSNGGFTFGGFPAGSYFLRTNVAATGLNGLAIPPNPYFDKLHGDTGSCSGFLCDPINGTPLDLDGSADVSSIELRVTPGPVIRGQIVDRNTGLPINGGYVDVYDDTSRYVGRFPVYWATGMYQTCALPEGTYTLVPYVSPAYGVAISGGTSPSSVRGGAPSGITVNFDAKGDLEVDATVVEDYVFSSRFQ